MGAPLGQFTRQIFDEEKLYLFHLLTKSKVWVDADENDGRRALYTGMRRIIQRTVGDGVSGGNTGFQIVGTGAVNNFTVKGGGGTGDTAGSMFVSGHIARLFSDVPLVPASATPTDREKSIHPRVTGLAPLVLTDSAASYIVNELVGRLLRPSAESLTTFLITANTGTTITIGAGDLTTVSAAGKHYIVQPSTPGLARVDTVWLNVYEDEYDSLDDPNLLHNINGPKEAQIRVKLIRTIQLREGNATALADYVDADGNQHYCIKLATLNRDADPDIEAGEVVDERPVITIAQSVSGQGVSVVSSGGLRTAHNQDPTPVWVYAEDPTTRLAWNSATNTLTWTGDLKVLYVSPSGALIGNTILAAALAGIVAGDYLYADLSAVDGGLITIQKQAGRPLVQAQRVDLAYRVSSVIIWRGDQILQNMSVLALNAAAVTPGGLHSSVIDGLTNANPLVSAANPYAVVSDTSGFLGARSGVLAGLGSGVFINWTWPLGTTEIELFVSANAGTNHYESGGSFVIVISGGSAFITGGWTRTWVVTAGIGTNYSSTLVTAGLQVAESATIAALTVGTRNIQIATTIGAANSLAAARASLFARR